MKQLTKLFLAGLCAAFIFTACSSDDDEPPYVSKGDVAKEQIAEVLEKNEKISAFAESFKKLDLSGVNSSELTVFALTNEALGSAEKAISRDSTSNNVPTISTAEVKRYVAEGAYSLDKLKGISALKMINGESATISVSGGVVSINGVELSTSTSTEGNIIFVIAKPFPAKPVPSKMKRLVKMEREDSDMSMTFTYTESGLISSITEIYEDEVDGDSAHVDKKFDMKNSKVFRTKASSTPVLDTAVTTFTYSNDKLTRAVTKEDRYDFRYSGNNTVYVDYYFNDSKDYTDTLIIDPANNCLLNAYTRYNGVGECSYDAASNFLGIKYQDDEDYPYTETYTYDKKVSAFSYINNTAFPKWYWGYTTEMMGVGYMGPNNTLIRTETDTYYEDKTVFSYQYDADGYPTGADATSEYKYRGSQQQTDKYKIKYIYEDVE